MATLTSYSQTTPTSVNGALWDLLANATGSTTGTYATFTNSTSNDTGNVTYRNFGTWSSIPSGSTINNVVVTVKGYVNNTSRMLAPTIEVHTVGLKGSATLSTHSATSTNIYSGVTVTGITLSDLNNNYLAVVFYARKAATTQQGIQYVDYFKIDVNYTAPVVGSNVKYWSGSTWVLKPIKVYLSGSWQTKPVKRWSGSSWITL